MNSLSLLFKRILIALSLIGMTGQMLFAAENSSAPASATDVAKKAKKKKKKPLPKKQEDKDIELAQRARALKKGVDMRIDALLAEGANPYASVDYGSRTSLLCVLIQEGNVDALNYLVKRIKNFDIEKVIAELDKIEFNIVTACMFYKSLPMIKNLKNIASEPVLKKMMRKKLTVIDRDNDFAPALQKMLKKEIVVCNGAVMTMLFFAGEAFDQNILEILKVLISYGALTDNVRDGEGLTLADKAIELNLPADYRELLFGEKIEPAQATDFEKKMDQLATSLYPNFDPNGELNCDEALDSMWESILAEHRIDDYRVGSLVSNVESQSSSSSSAISSASGASSSMAAAVPVMIPVEISVLSDEELFSVMAQEKDQQKFKDYFKSYSAQLKLADAKGQLFARLLSDDCVEREVKLANLLEREPNLRAIDVAQIEKWHLNQALEKRIKKMQNKQLGIVPASAAALHEAVPAVERNVEPVERKVEIKVAAPRKPVQTKKQKQAEKRKAEQEAKRLAHIERRNQKALDDAIAAEKAAALAAEKAEQDCKLAEANAEKANYEFELAVRKDKQLEARRLAEIARVERERHPAYVEWQAKRAAQKELEKKEAAEQHALYLETKVVEVKKDNAPQVSVAQAIAASQEELKGSAIAQSVLEQPAQELPHEEWLRLQLQSNDFQALKALSFGATHAGDWLGLRKILNRLKELDPTLVVELITNAERETLLSYAARCEKIDVIKMLMKDFRCSIYPIGTEKRLETYAHEQLLQGKAALMTHLQQHATQRRDVQSLSILSAGLIQALKNTAKPSAPAAPQGT